MDERVFGVPRELAARRAVESITLRDSCLEARSAADGHSLTAVCTHMASPVLVILKAGRSARG
jgi:hypothetical protein